MAKPAAAAATSPRQKKAPAGQGRIALNEARDRRESGQKDVWRQLGQKRLPSAPSAPARAQMKLERKAVETGAPAAPSRWGDAAGRRAPAHVEGGRPRGRPPDRAGLSVPASHRPAPGRSVVAWPFRGAATWPRSWWWSLTAPVRLRAQAGPAAQAVRSLTLPHAGCGWPWRAPLPGLVRHRRVTPITARSGPGPPGAGGDGMIGTRSPHDPSNPCPHTIRLAVPSDLPVLMSLRLALFEELGHPLGGRPRPDHREHRPLVLSEHEAGCSDLAGRDPGWRRRPHADPWPCSTVCPTAACQGPRRLSPEHATPCGKLPWHGRWPVMRS